MDNTEFILLPNPVFSEEYDSVVVGPRRSLYYMDDTEGLKSISLREVKTFIVGDDIEEAAEGIWISENLLAPLEDDDFTDFYKPGKFLRKFVHYWQESPIEIVEAAVVEYSDRLQCAIMISKDGKIKDDGIFSHYYKKIHLGTIKHLLERCSSGDFDHESLIDKLKELI